jgi:hypothetical protein
MLAFPAIAIEAPSSGWRDRIGTAFHHSHGNFRLLLCGFGILLCTTIPPWLALYFFVGGWDNDRMLASWPYLAGEAFIIIMFEVLVASGISWIYAWVMDPKIQITSPIQ